MPWLVPRFAKIFLAARLDVKARAEGRCCSQVAAAFQLGFVLFHGNDAADLQCPTGLTRYTERALSGSMRRGWLASMSRVKLRFPIPSARLACKEHPLSRRSRASIPRSEQRIANSE